MKRMGGGSAKINHAQATEPKSGHRAPAGPKGMNSEVGGETKAAVATAQASEPSSHNPLRHAVKHLHSEHPEAHDDLGPHHGGTSHHIKR